MRSLVRTALFRPLVHKPVVSLYLPCHRSFTRAIPRFSTSGYGDDPSKQSNQQSSRPRIDTEHPGREPVDEGKGTGSGGYAETGEKVGGGRDGTGGAGKDEPVAQRKGKDQGGLGSSGDKRGAGSLADMEKQMPDEGEKEDVKRHNREMDKRYGHKQGGEKDEKVGKGFWAGHGGRDRDP